ncbi:DUF5134 domain-containing protein [Streptomyces piniterrae]|uniref:DUF5134 domain-containing protein n=1 Tax=Streptomyces piniterrae TaxID=2571125 RepID=A0A4U0MT62_9ACTN|nr:DUF5134 domain-containing protein [Streptomyces piniterrae]TJZ44109.1 DUF5134 domain-containing protein [Streptomyces piniterrae]
MHGPPWVGWLLVLLGAAAGGYCLSRAGTGTAAQRVEARGEALMGLGMAVMALPASAVAPPSWSPWLFAGVFGAAGLRALALRHPHHVVSSGAMVYMALAMTAAPETPAGLAGHVAHTGHSAPGGVPLLTGLLLGYYSLFVITAGIRLAPAGAAGPAGAACTPTAVATGGIAAVPRPEVLGACRLAMGIGMFAMLLAL